jgi:cytochrome c oxidase assembly factor CtaG
MTTIIAAAPGDNDGVMPAPSPTALLTQWTWQPLAITAVVLLAAWYLRAVRRVRGWPVRHSLTFAAGLLLVVWTTCGFPGAYLDSLFWVWTSQQLALLLVVPFVVLSGRPLGLVRPTSVVARALQSRFARVLSNPLIGPAAVPLLSVVLFFGPVPRWAITVPVFGWIEQLLVLLVGALIVLPLVGTDELPSSLRVGLALAIGSFELVLDAVPGIALRLHRSLSTSYFDARAVHSWTPGALHDQQTSGAILWCVAELLDLPFLVLVFRQWIRADARDAAQVDAVLEAERVARSTPEDERDVPWWLTDSSVRDRLR